MPTRTLTVTFSRKTICQSNPKAGTSAETVSGRLPAGTYTLTVKNDSKEGPVNGGFYPLAMHPFVNFRVHTDIKPFDSRKIEGRVSIEGSPVSMPVSMSVAEFANNGDRKASTEVAPLNPNLPVWVVVHGRSNNENSSQIAELTRSLQALGVQVVSLDWHDEANANLTPIGLEGSRWIENVGAWGSSQLQSLGFSGSNVNVIGHSWGSYVSHEIGAHIPGGVQTLVALDPAADTPVLGGGQYKGFNDPNFKFTDVASNSYAFHSSKFGDPKKALSAEYSFDIRTPEGYENGNSIITNLQDIVRKYFESPLQLVLEEIADETADTLREHGFAVSLFTEMLTRQKNGSTESAPNLFTPQKLRSTTDEVMKQSEYEGVFYVAPQYVANTIGTEAGQKTWKATQFGFSGKDAQGNAILDLKSL